MTRTAVVGCGDVSVVHLQAIAALDGVDLVGVCDTDADRAAATGQRYGVAHFTRHDDLLRATRPHVVHVCTPHHQHVPVAVDCVRAGAAVLVEKPVAHLLADADRLVQVARRHPQVKTGTCLQNRYNATSRRARALLESGELGTVRGASAAVLWHRREAYYRARPWRGRRATSGGGVLINQAIHTLDLLQWLLGDVEDVRGHTGRYVLDGDTDVEDTAHVLLEHVGGARSVLFATVGNVIDAPVTIEIVTDAAVLLIRDGLTVSYRDGRTERVPEPASDPRTPAYWGASHELLIADFYRGLPDPRPFWIDLEEGTRSLRLVQQIYRLTG